MLLRVNEITVDTNWLRCHRNTVNGDRCQTYCGDKGIVEVVSEGDIIKFNVTCGTHVNKCAGDDVRFNVRNDALASSTLIDGTRGTEIMFSDVSFNEPKCQHTDCTDPYNPHISHGDH